jgi:hypothetical protein
LNDDAEFGKNLASLSNQFAASRIADFQLQKPRQLFIRTRNETLPIVAVCINNPDCSSVEINR